MMTRIMFAMAVLILCAAIIGEFRVSRTNTDRLLRLGGKVSGTHQTTLFFVLTILWVIASISEVFLLQRNIHIISLLVGTALIVLGKSLRDRAYSALGQRWSLDIVSLPGSPLVAGQIYERMRHPEYVGVLLILTGVPILHNAWLSVAGLLVPSLLLLFQRVKKEEKVLDHDARYMSILGDRPRFYPRQVKKDLIREPLSPTWLTPRKHNNGKPDRF